MDPTRFPLNLNFQRTASNNAGQNSESDQTYPATDGGVYPTTPSTFPQPVFQSMHPGQQQPQQDYLNPNAQMQSPTAQAYAGNAQGYFANTSYSQYGQQGQYSQQGYQQSLTSPQAYSPRPVHPNDPNSGLAYQFSNQNLGAQGRQNNYGRPSPLGPGSRPSPQQQHSYSSHLNPFSPSSQTAQTDEKPPPQDPNRFSSNVYKRVVGLHLYVEKFFKDNIQRARERNVRAQEYEQFCRAPQSTKTKQKEEGQRYLLRETDYLRRLRAVDSTRQFQTIKIIGKGAFGEVRLVQRKTDAKIFALKALVKAEMFKKDQLAHVRAERDLLAEADSPWVVKLYNTFQDKAFLYMLMEFLPGGDLMTMLIKYETFAPDIARFYMAEVLLAIEAVHNLGFIHRDIKPDNILLDVTGHLKLTDFGLSTGFHKQHEGSYYQQLLRGTSDRPRRDNRVSVNLDQINLTVSNRGQINNWRKSRRAMAYSTVGTPDYIAPEIFSGRGYSFSCDWWSLGAIMYESIVGWPPFCADDPHDTYRKIVDWRNTFYFPDDGPPLEDAATDLIRQLLCDAESRLGHSGSSHGALEIKNHRYFRGVQWDRIRDMNAPFKPNLGSNVDTTYFPIDDIDQTDRTAEWEHQAHQISEEHAAEMSIPFIGYTYKRY
ncbi:Serine/threonine-protein kinase [Thelotrema lepadinum]|nr:Serine/threonine-protein kinase [Thelotrema lepadinum]